MRTIIIGGPRSGKSTLAQTFGCPVFCADPKNLVKDVIDGVTYLPDAIEWDQQSHFICNNWFTMDCDWVIEGVSVVRALRKWAKYYDTNPPCYNIIYIKNIHPLASNILDGQIAMAKSIDTIWSEISNFYEPITQYKFWHSENTKSIQDTMNKNNKAKNEFRMFQG